MGSSPNTVVKEDKLLLRVGHSLAWTRGNDDTVSLRAITRRTTRGVNDGRSRGNNINPQSHSDVLLETGSLDICRRLL